jgi:hypothetical protein
MSVRIRDGSRSFLNAAELLCKFSRFRGFSVGLTRILGAASAAELTAAFEPFCAVVDSLVAADNWFNQIDEVAEATGDEDTSFE